jgi:hypothetical protein
MSLPITVRRLDADKQQLSADPISIYGYRIYNPNNYTIYVKLYDALASNVVITNSAVTSTTPTLTVTCPALIETATDISQPFATALTIRCTTRNVDNDTNPPSDFPEVVFAITAAGSGTGDALVSQPLSQFAATTSAQLAGVISNETGTNHLVFSDNPTLTSPTINSPTLTSAALGQPASGDLTNCLSLPVTTGVNGWSAVAASTSPDQADAVVFYSQSLDAIRDITFTSLADNLQITGITDPTSNFTATFDVTGLTADRATRIADGASVTVIPGQRGAGQVVTAINGTGQVLVGYPDVSTETQFAADKNNYTNATDAYHLRYSTDGTRTITGLAGGQAGEVHIINCVLNSLVIAHQSASSTAANRFLNNTGADITLSVGQSALIVYDAVISRWICSSLAGGGGGGTPGGSSSQVQWDNSGSFGGISSMTTDGTIVTQKAGTNFVIVDPSDTTKKVVVDASNLTTANTRTFRIPDANFVGVIGGSSVSNQFVTTISVGGVISRAQPSVANLSDGSTGTGSVVMSTSPTLVTPVLGTPSSGTLTSCTGLPVSTGISGLGTGVATALAVNNNAAGGYSPIDGTATLSNKRITPRVTAITSNATWAPSADTDDVYEITAQAAAVTTISNPSGTPVDMQKLMIRVKDNGTARALTWSGSQWRASSDLALPTTTILSKTLYMGFIFNSADTKWDLVALLNNF